MNPRNNPAQAPETSRQGFLSRRNFLRLGAAFVASTTGLGLYTWRIEPHWVEFVERDLPIEHLPSSLEGRLLVQLSDIHVGPQVDDDYLRAVFARVGERQPDILVLTGDYMTSKWGEQIDHALHIFQELPQARLGTVAVLGNHDYGAHIDLTIAEKLTKGFQELDIRVLRNEIWRVEGLCIAGFDDIWSQQFRMEPIFDQLTGKEAVLGLVHNPDAVDIEEMVVFRAWILAGHTHGGQCKLPLFRPPILPVGNKDYVAGHYHLGDGRHMYINRGLGHLMRVRFNVRPEVTCFTLRRA